MISQVDELHKKKTEYCDREEDKCKLLNGSICYIFASPEALDEGRWKSTCGLCHCTKQNPPCSEYCTCVNRCIHVPSVNITPEGAAQGSYEGNSEFDDKISESESP